VDKSKLLTAERLVFGDYTEGIAAEPKLYSEVQDMQVLPPEDNRTCDKIRAEFRLTLWFVDLEML
jgi:hypothetical protein